MEMPGYWMDIGQPKDYLLGQSLYIDAQSLKPEGQHLISSPNGNPVIIHPSADVHSSAVLGPNVVIGADCKIGEGVKIRNSTILAGTTVKAYSLITDSIIGWRSTVGSWVRITDMTCTAEGVNIKDESCLSGVKVLHHIPVAGTHKDTVLMM